MKLCNLLKNDTVHLGVLCNADVIDVAEALNHYPDEEIAKNLGDYIHKTNRLNKLKQYIKVLPKSAGESYIYAEEDCQFGPAASKPEKVICIGLNYRKHADETESPYPEVPILFSKFNNALTGHNQYINIPETTDKLDYEAELAIVIGSTAKNISKEAALDYVFGYTPANDLSARDLQMRTPQWLLGKTSDGFAPVGPFITTADEVNDPGDLKIQSYVNRELRQNSNTSDMIFSCREIISYLSKHMTLKPGDIILTGTPEGVVMGLPEADQVYLKEGDTVTVTIEELGTLTNKFVRR